MANKKVTPKETDSVLIKAATTIGRAAGKLASLVTSKAKRTKQEPRARPTKPRARKAKPSPTKKASAPKIASTKAGKTIKKRNRKV